MGHKIAVPRSAEVRRLRGQLAIRVRWHGEDHPETIAIRRELRVATAEQTIADLLEAEPALSAADRNQLAAMLTGDGDD